MKGQENGQTSQKGGEISKVGKRSTKCDFLRKKIVQLAKRDQQNVLVLRRFWRTSVRRHLA